MLEPWNLEISHARKKQRRADLCKLTRRPLLPIGMLGMQQAHRAKPSATGNAVEDKRSVDFYRACYLLMIRVRTSEQRLMRNYSNNTALPSALCGFDSAGPPCMGQPEHMAVPVLTCRAEVAPADSANTRTALCDLPAKRVTTKSAEHQ